MTSIADSVDRPVADPLLALAWPAHRLGEALEALASRSGLRSRGGKASNGVLTSVLPPPVGAEHWDIEAAGHWVMRAADFLGFEAEPVELPYRDAHAAVARLGPALLMLRNASGPAFLAVLPGRGRKTLVLAPDHTVTRVDAGLIADRLCGPLEEPLAASIDRVLDRAQIAPRKRHRARRSLFLGRLGSVVLPGIWFLRLPPTAPLLAQAKHLRVGFRILAFVAAQLAGSMAMVLAWLTFGQSTLDDQAEFDRLLGAALLLLTSIPLKVLASWTFGRLAIDLGAFVKRRLLSGALALDVDDTRKEGAGVLLSRVLESEMVEVLGLRSGLLLFTSFFELVLAVWVFRAGVSSHLELLLLGGWLFVTIIGWARYHAKRREWTHVQLGMTHDLIERMVGHRTRLAQERSERWHDGEDEGLERYFEASRRVDQQQVALTALSPRMYMIAGLLAMAPGFVSGNGTTLTIALSLVGVLVARGALTSLTAGLSSLSGAMIAWRTTGQLMRAARLAGEAPRTPPVPPAQNDARREGYVVLDARELTFRHRDRAEAVLRGVNLRIGAGERILLEGPSGSGKSTLGAIVAGLRVPSSGLLLLDGFDRHSLGLEEWHRRVAAAPQFHENHILTGTLALNVLMGRRWPPRQKDVEEAVKLCHELGLGELLARMPAGFEQMVGETGWQLSHGEKSRIYIARALLQDASVIVLDESFAALDPETMTRVMQCVLSRAPAMLVIAHP
ncbi:MAG: ATP-binding cassette domain-containing protein [Polyangiaceae bacterium]|nr:ATP-binding cassette domain-containing protein [Polyangiaceae bacterium]